MLLLTVYLFIHIRHDLNQLTNSTIKLNTNNKFIIQELVNNQKTIEMQSSQQLKRTHQQSAAQTNRMKQHSHLQMYKTAYHQLQHSFKNNLNVIKQLQQENTLLHQHLTQFQLQYQRRLEMQMKQSQDKHQEEIIKQEVNFGRQIELVKKQYQDFISTINLNMENQSQEVVKALSKKHKTEIKQVSASYQRQISQLVGQVKKLQKHNNQLQQNITKAQTQVNSGQLKLITLQTQLQKAQKQRQQTQTLYTGYQQQLQTLKQSNNSWQEMLKQRIRQLQQQKCSLQQEMTESRFLHKEKQKKLAQQHSKRITQLEQAYSMKMNDMLRQSKQIRFRFQNIKQENSQLKGELDKCKRELTQTSKQLQAQQAKCITAQDSILVIKQKQYQLNSAQEENKRLKNQIAAMQQQQKQIKQQLSKVNYQRETAEKALQRLKVQLLNKAKQVQQLRKQLSKVKYNQQIISYNNAKNYVPQSKAQVVGGDAAQNKRSLYEQQQHQGGIDYSQCFTQDMGPVDENFFLPNSSLGRKPPVINRQYGQIPQHNEEFTSRGKEQTGDKETITQLMKRIGQLQVQSDQYKSIIKTIKQEMQRTAVVMDDKLSLKDREIKLGKQENMMLRQRLNSKQEQLIDMKQTIQKHKQHQLSYEDVIKQKLQLTKSLQQNRKITEENKLLSEKVHQLEQQVQYLKRERETLEEIADQLKAELEDLKDEMAQLDEIGEERGCREVNVGRGRLQYHTGQDNSRQSYQSYQQSIKQHANYHKPTSQHQNNFIPTKQQQQSKLQPYKPNHHQQQRSKSNSPKQHLNQQSTKPKQSFGIKPTVVKKKLHELIKQKNTLQMQNTPIIGRKANLQRRSEQERTQHVGTMSQKQAYQRIQRVSKSRSKQKLPSKLKDYQIPQSLALNSNQQFRNQPQPLAQPQLQHAQQQDLQHDDDFSKRIQIMNRLREQIRNDSLGQFDQLQNVSLTYWQQQV